MSVLECDRNGCGNVMCDRYSFEYGYICNECFEELILTGPTTDIKIFMNTVKQPYKREEAEARYKVAFKER